MVCMETERIEESNIVDKYISNILLHYEFILEHRKYRELKRHIVAPI